MKLIISLNSKFVFFSRMFLIILSIGSLKLKAQVILDKFDGSTLGKAYGITYITTPTGKGAVLSRNKESRIEYPFSMGLPHEGTIELLIKLTNGYSYNNYKLNDNEKSALIFTTNPSDSWRIGAMWLSVSDNGEVSLTTSISNDEANSHVLSANNTSFKYNEWHTISFSFGSQGQYINVDGKLVASNPSFKESLQTCWDPGQQKYDVPTIGEEHSVVWGNNQYDHGFEGIVDCFRSSHSQLDWVLNSTVTQSLSTNGKLVSEIIKKYVEKKVSEWQQKGEFEKSSEYKVRVNETTRAKKIEEYQLEAINEFKKQFSESINYKDLKLGTYDADNECFLLNSSQLGEFVIPVPRADAPTFKQNFNSLKFKNSDFYIKDDNFVLSHLEVLGSNNKNYTYDSKNKMTYALTKIDYKFTDIQVDVEDKTVSKSNSIKSTNTITVGKPDVDTDIPVNTTLKTNTYVLIIGNEDYSSFQTGLNTEVNVDFAMNDAKMFKEYCNKIFGIPEKQIKLLINATSGQMNQGIAWLNNLAKVDNGNAEVIFYYSGHGLPDEQTKESYLMPVDISGSNVTQAIKLTDVYNKLNEFPSKKVVVFLDACFSGGARNQGLIAMKGVKIKPKENMVTGNMIVISSSTGEESSGVYRDKQHGFMTYFLLKKLQESKGNISYKELADFIIENVKKETALSGKTQTPQLNYSPNIENSWPNWKIK